MGSSHCRNFPDTVLKSHRSEMLDGNGCVEQVSSTTTTITELPLLWPRAFVVKVECSVNYRYQVHTSSQIHPVVDYYGIISHRLLSFCLISFLYSFGAFSMTFATKHQFCQPTHGLIPCRFIASLVFQGLVVDH